MGDINGDGLRDLFISNGPDSPNTAYFVFGARSLPPVLLLATLDGSNGFALRAPTGVPQFVESADFNGDSILDLIYVAPNSNDVHVVFGGPRQFAAIVLLSAFEAVGRTLIVNSDVKTTSVSAAYFNGDSYADIVIIAGGNLHVVRIF